MNITIHKFIVCFSVFLFILVSYDTFYFGTNSNSILTSLKYVIYVLSLAAYLSYFIFTKSKLPNKLLFILTIIVITTLLSGVINNSISAGILLVIILYSIAFFFVVKIPFSDFAKCFSDIIYLISILSLLSFIFFLLFKYSYDFTSVVNSNNLKITNVLGILLFSDNILPRNSGIFREPGVFIIYINIAALLDIYVNKRPNRQIIYLLTNLSSLSTAGIIISILITIVYYISSNISKSKRIVLLGLFFGLVLILFSYSDNLYLLVFSKLVRGNESMSTLARFSSITIPVAIFLDNPIFGSGIEDFNNLYISTGLEQYGVILNPQGVSTNTIFNTFAIFGLIPGLFFIVSFFSLAVRIVNKKNYFLVFCIFAFFVMLYSNEDLRQSPITIILLMYGTQLLTSSNHSNHELEQF